MMLRPTWQTSAFVCFIAAATAWVSCRPINLNPRDRRGSTGSRTSSTRGKAPPKAEHHDEDYVVGRKVRAHHYLLHQSLLIDAAVAHYTSRTPEAQQEAKKIASLSTLTSRVYVFGDRMLLMAPESSPAADLRIVLAFDRGTATAFDGKKWAYTVPIEQFADLVDFSPPSHRAVTNSQWVNKPHPVEMKSCSIPCSNTCPVDCVLPNPQRRGLLTSYLSMSANFSIEISRAQELPFSLQSRLELTTQAGNRSGHSASPLYALVLPHFVGNHIGSSIEALARAGGIPTRWRVRYTNQRNRHNHAPTLAATLVDHGPMSIPLNHFAIVRPGVRSGHRLPRLQRSGVQVLSQEPLKRLRPTSTSERIETLVVANPSLQAALVYIDGMLLGWVAPENTFRFHGIPRGFYRLYALAPSGAKSWGPRDTFVGGTFSLE